MGLGNKFTVATFPGRGILVASLASMLEMEIGDEQDGNFTSFDVFIPSIPCRNMSAGERYQQTKTPAYPFVRQPI
jgi:hypothetical protein